ncbi:MAG: type II toxin-antitoxin system RelE/ParE family toxin [Candidatus Omnitrophica bacterium]|nr:type II toxin-antitoxin system RelE/ParE family toxin [Candidatus Omnitrophota bacterium]MCA9427494.1 type II toxin-antitoxin system RelE/ParE family toxin [Candidatus Omnitrophota bacterium]MCA9437728.1 type II toxin-antitoxin system RelE/ParE family toxin [Candidatus Omnitrophota bacterium]MCB9769782.1 type II toxin-antitoxin system RelE/ParE family toxin [Candidatus Omnitrophota bacterium]
MNFAFHPKAEHEFYEAIAFYEEARDSLGFDFASEVYQSISSICNYPKAWPVVSDDIRRCLINRFPYGILYSESEDEIFIYSVMHLRRDPDYWKGRI